MYKADKRFMNMIYITRVYHIHSEKIVCIVEKPTIFLILWPQGWSYVSYYEYLATRVVVRSMCLFKNS